MGAGEEYQVLGNLTHLCVKDKEENKKRSEDGDEGLSLKLLVPASQCGALIGTHSLQINVSDPFYFDTDPDPAPNRENIYFCFTLFFY